MSDLPPPEPETATAPAPFGPDEQWVSVQTVGELFEVTPETVRNWIEKGYITAIKIDRVFRISRQSLREFANSRYEN
jgi:excisionase family DNA binding protein